MDSKNHSTLRTFIDQWLFRADLRQGQLARRARISEATLARVKQGKQKAGDKVLQRLEMAMNLAPGTLVALRDQAQAVSEGEEA